jgi:hypothetical protein
MPIPIMDIFASPVGLNVDFNSLLEKLHELFVVILY